VNGEFLDGTKFGDIEFCDRLGSVLTSVYTLGGLAFTRRAGWRVVGRCR